MAPKLLPCKNCRTNAIAPPNDRFPAGEPMVVGMVATYPLIYKCFRCKSSYKVTAREMAKLPRLTPQDLATLGF